MLKLFAVLYLKGQLVAAMFLWSGATVEDCEGFNALYAAELFDMPGIKSGEVALTDVRLACEWHERNPILH